MKTKQIHGLMSDFDGEEISLIVFSPFISLNATKHLGQSSAFIMTPAAIISCK